MMNCREATRIMSESQERQLGLKERIAIKMHTAMCSGCRNFSKQMHILGEIMREYAAGGDEKAKADKKGDK